MNEPRPSYEELEARLARAEDLIAALKGSEVDAVLGREDISFVRERSAEERARAFQAELERQVAEHTELAETRARQLQNLARELLEAEERERKRIARLLHDDLQQLLASAKMQLGLVGQNALHDPILARIDELLKDSIDKVRNLSHELSPSVLSHSGLVDALEWLAKSFEEWFGFHVQIDTDVEECFENETLRIFIFRAVQELLFNAAKHAGVDNARVCLSKSDGSLVIAVSDQGSGFNPDPQFLSAKYGFGLISLKERAKSMGGDLTVESAPGRGSCFTLTVPLPNARENTPRESGYKKATRRPDEGVDTSAGDVIRVLLVDDHQVMRQALCTMLCNYPEIHVAGEAASGGEAVESVRDLCPDLVLMDVSIPGMDGVEATRIIRSEWPGVQVIALSMYEDEQIIERMKRAGAGAFMNKSVSSEELLQAIYEIVRYDQI